MRARHAGFQDLFGAVSILAVELTVVWTLGYPYAHAFPSGPDVL